jgi:hypothetical protein
LTKLSAQLAAISDRSMVNFRLMLAASLIGLVILPLSAATISRPANSPAKPTTPATAHQLAQTHSKSKPFNRLWWSLLLLPIGGGTALLYRQQSKSGVSPQVVGQPGLPTDSFPDSLSEQNPSEALEPTATRPAELPSIAITETQPYTTATRLAKIDIVEALVSDLQNPDAAKRRQSIWELGQLGDSRAVQPLVDLLIDSDSQQRSLILGAISEINARSLKPMTRALMLALQDESPDVRRNAIRDVTRVYEQMTQVSHLLHYAASDSDSDVQETADWALSQLNRMHLVPNLPSAAATEVDKATDQPSALNRHESGHPGHQ